MYTSAIRDRRDLRHAIRGFGGSLGQTPAAVASRLKSWDVRGTPRDSNGCAIARCLRAIIGADPSVANIWVTDRRVHVKRSGSRVPIIVKLPKPVCSFIRAFDSGCYAELAIDFQTAASLRWRMSSRHRRRQKGVEARPADLRAQAKNGAGRGRARRRELNSNAGNSRQRRTSYIG